MQYSVVDLYSYLFTFNTVCSYRELTLPTYLNYLLSCVMTTAWYIVLVSGGSRWGRNRCAPPVLSAMHEKKWQKKNASTCVKYSTILLSVLFQKQKFSKGGGETPFPYTPTQDSNQTLHPLYGKFLDMPLLFSFFAHLMTSDILLHYKFSCLNRVIGYHPNSLGWGPSISLSKSYHFMISYKNINFVTKNLYDNLNNNYCKEKRTNPITVTSCLQIILWLCMILLLWHILYIKMISCMVN